MSGFAPSFSVSRSRNVLEVAKGRSLNQYYNIGILSSHEVSSRKDARTHSFCHISCGGGTSRVPCTELPNRLCDLVVPVRKLASLNALHACACRVHPAHHPMACRAATSNLALPDGRELFNSGEKRAPAQNFGHTGSQTSSQTTISSAESGCLGAYGCAARRLS